MPFFVYVAVLVTALFSIALEWDVLVVPSVASRRPTQAVIRVTPPAGMQTHGGAAVDNAPAPLVVTPLGAAEDDAMVQKPAAPAAAAQPLCDVAACTAAYHSFRASDCTYMPTAGVRRLCTKGKPPQ